MFQNIVTILSIKIRNDLPLPLPVSNLCNPRQTHATLPSFVTARDAVTP